MELKDVADLFDRGFDCTQCVVAAFRDELGEDYDTVMKSAACLGMGMFQRAICGAALGAMVVIGWRYGTAEPDYSAKGLCLIKRQQFFKEWGEGHDGLTCPDLMGLDVTTSEGNLQAYAQGKYQNDCPRLCLKAIEITKRLIE